MDTLKSDFFANVTHEFRTPLTIILNATEQLVSSSLAPTQQQQTDNHSTACSPIASTDHRNA
ncbi:histidine kinase dimerization/phospho-acceptor domain-containing protein [Spirosoma flavus]